MDFEENIRKTQTLLRQNKLDALLVTNPFNVYYLTGFKGISETERESVALITSKNLVFFLPRLYQGEGKTLAGSKKVKLKIVEERHDLLTVPLRDFLSQWKVGLEAVDLKLIEYEQIQKQTKSKLVKTTGFIEKLRAIKSKAELRNIRKAVELTDLAFKKIKQEIRVGMTERQVASRMEEIFWEIGSEGTSFPTIVASGKASALPHYLPQNKKIGPGILLIDAGAKYKGYCGDLTRTFYIGDPDKKFVSTYNQILENQKLALENCKEGIIEENLWKLSNDGFGNQAKYFLHGLGHGIGLEVHEVPFLRKGKQGKLRERMIVTIEPGLYYQGWGGIRIEDYVVVGKDKSEILSKAKKDLPSLIISTTKALSK